MFFAVFYNVLEETPHVLLVIVRALAICNRN